MTQACHRHARLNIVGVFGDRDGARAMARAGQAFVRGHLSIDAQMAITTGVYRARISSGHGFVVGFSPVLQVTTS